MNDKVVAITAAMPNGTALDLFRPHHPKRYFDVGIAEEHAVLFAAGMATKGFQPLLRHLLHLPPARLRPDRPRRLPAELPVVFCMDRGGLSGDDGPTHHGLFDISYLRCIPNIVHMDPKDEDELPDMLFTALQHDGPIAIRYPRGTGPGTPVKEAPHALEIGKAEVLQRRHQRRRDLLASAACCPRPNASPQCCARKARALPSSTRASPSPSITSASRATPKRCSLLVTFEDHVLAGGFGSAVLESLAEQGIETPVVRIGWPDQFIEHGKVESLRAKYGLTAEAALERVRPHLRHAVEV